MDSPSPRVGIFPKNLPTTKSLPKRTSRRSLTLMKCGIPVGDFFAPIFFGGFFQGGKKHPLGFQVLGITQRKGDFLAKCFGWDFFHPKFSRSWHLWHLRIPNQLEPGLGDSSNAWLLYSALAMALWESVKPKTAQHPTSRGSRGMGLMDFDDDFAGGVFPTLQHGLPELFSRRVAGRSADAVRNLRFGSWPGGLLLGFMESNPWWFGGGGYHGKHLKDLELVNNASGIRCFTPNLITNSSLTLQEAPEQRNRPCIVPRRKQIQQDTILQQWKW